MIPIPQLLQKLTIRKSRSVWVIFGLILVNVLFISYLQLTPIQQYVSDTINISKLRKLLTGQDSYYELAEFDVQVVELMQQQENLLKQQSTHGTFDDETQQKIDIAVQVLKETTFKNDKSFEVINIPPKEQIPQFQPYDPRFTFGLLLKFINSMASEHDQQKLTIPFFHWADYTDMSAMEPYLFNPQKQDCKYFDATKEDPATNKQQRIFETKDYCVEDADIDRILKDEESQKQYSAETLASFRRIKEQQESNPLLTTGFHIFSNSGRNKRALRPIIARSYLYDFMPLPLTLTLLLPGGKSVQYGVNTNERKKLRDSDMIKEGKLNIKDEIESLASKFTKDEKFLSYEKHLKQEDFVDKTSSKILALEAQTTPLNLTDQSYLNSLRTSLHTKDAPKYFYEANIVRDEPHFSLGGHYDWRFFNGIINDTPQQEVAINGLLKAFLRLTNQYNINTWIAHGSLLSWYWNGLQFPWDADIDVQMPIQDLHRLSQLFNQSVIVDFGNDLDSELRFGRYYIDSSTFISHRMKGQGLNNIDARFIDLDTGLYVDITALALSAEPAPPRYEAMLANTEFDKNKHESTISQMDRNEFLQIYNCRNNHFSQFGELSPLRLSSIQGDYGYIPPGFEILLLEEYKEKGLASTLYKERVYLPKLRQWVWDVPLSNYVTDKFGAGAKDKMTHVKEGDIEFKTFNMTNEEYIDYLYHNESILREFIASHKVTSLHNLEIQTLLDKKSTMDLFVDPGAEVLRDDPVRANLQLDYFIHQSRHVEGGYDLDKEMQRLRNKIREAEVNYQEAHAGQVEEQPNEGGGAE
ncbi:hypothetical protein I9W82_005163 [Candida metapsilosis]|uniref:LicD/FKTN/FKRP nucleotidyltransferase domain-containing protein n=1 Tax=Candida metapsilosis TaxID=273372 RepID=A0A8H7ZF33_9ASCO|nr:hypothetical protein I9W82_005163 [Candida metapsilosis]